MTRTDFLRALESELGLPAESLKQNQELAGLESWDSMAAVQFIALADEKVGIIISGDQIANARTINELLSLCGDRLSA